jgi:serine/threonine-protein kinase RsbW
VLPSEVQLIAPVVDDIVTLCQAAGFSPRQCRLNVPVAVTEALANAMLKGNGNDGRRAVRVGVEIANGRLVVEVCDEGCGFDLEAAGRTPADADWLESEDGRGIFLMRQLMDRVENQCPSGACGHLLRLILHQA